MRKPILLNIAGAKIALYKMEEVEAVTVMMRFNAGSWFEGKDWGTHHLLEHVILDGSKKFKDEEAIELYKEENGLITNGATGGRLLEFWLRAPSIKLKEGLELLFDTVFNPLLREEDSARNKTIIAQEYRDKWSDPHSRFGKAVSSNLYGDLHPYTRDGMGEIDYVKNVSREELLSIYNEYCVTNNLTMVVVGNFDVEKLSNTLRKKLDGEKVGKSHKAVIEATHPKEKSIFWKEDVMKVTIGVDWMTSKLNDAVPMKDVIATNLGKYILGGSSRSRLSKELRMKRGWVYGASAGRQLLPTEAGLWASTSTDMEKASDVYKLLLSIPEDLVKNGISDDEFNRAKSFLNMQTLINFDSVGAIAGKLMSDLFFEGKIYMPEEIVEITNTITKEDVIELMSIFLSTEPYISVMAKEDPHLL